MSSYNRKITSENSHGLAMEWFHIILKKKLVKDDENSKKIWLKECIFELEEYCISRKFSIFEAKID